jgi:hypothetical protein
MRQHTQIYSPVLLKAKTGIQVYNLGCANPDCTVIGYRVIGGSVVKYTTPSALEAIAPPAP